MKHILSLTFLFSLLLPCISHPFTVNNAPFAFERRYNANSFILNSTNYYEQYTPKRQPLGNEAIEKRKQRKARKKGGPRVFTHYASE